MAEVNIYVLERFQNSTAATQLDFASKLAMERKGRFSLELARSIAVDFAVIFGVATNH
jgi:hypothetical protein